MGGSSRQRDSYMCPSSTTPSTPSDVSAASAVVRRPGGGCKSDPKREDDDRLEREGAGGGAKNRSAPARNGPVHTSTQLLSRSTTPFESRFRSRTMSLGQMVPTL